MATQAQLVDNDAFSRLLEIYPEKRPYEMGGYLYLTVKERDGWQTYRTYGHKWRWLYQCARVNTQANAAGGALYTRVRIGSGIMAELVMMSAIGPTTNTTLSADVSDEDGTYPSVLLSIAAGATRKGSIPTIGVANTSSGAMQTMGMKFGPGQIIRWYSAAAAQTETLSLYVVFLLPITAASDGSDITWDTTGSAGTPGLGASTISAANTMQAVLLP